MIENYCRENGINPVKLFENGRINKQQYREDPEKFRTNVQEIDRYKYPRSQEPIDLMTMYSHNELKWLLPKKVIADNDKKRLAWFHQKKDELVEDTPLTRRVRDLSSTERFHG